MFFFFSFFPFILSPIFGNIDFFVSHISCVNDRHPTKILPLEYFENFENLPIFSESHNDYAGKIKGFLLKALYVNLVAEL